MSQRNGREQEVVESDPSLTDQFVQAAKRPRVVGFVLPSDALPKQPASFLHKLPKLIHRRNERVVASGTQPDETRRSNRDAAISTQPDHGTIRRSVRDEEPSVVPVFSSREGRGTVNDTVVTSERNTDRPTAIRAQAVTEERQQRPRTILEVSPVRRTEITTPPGDRVETIPHTAPQPKRKPAPQENRKATAMDMLW